MLCVAVATNKNTAQKVLCMATKHIISRGDVATKRGQVQVLIDSAHELLSYTGGLTSELKATRLYAARRSEQGFRLG